VHPCMPECQTHIGCLLTEFDHTCTTVGLQGKDEHIKFGGRTVKGQGHGGVIYAPNYTFWPCSGVGGGIIVDGVVATI